MALVPDAAVLQTRLAGLPITEYQPGENVPFSWFYHRKAFRFEEWRG